ncbi:hypothetical protein [Prosthecobacter sp.]
MVRCRTLMDGRASPRPSYGRLRDDKQPVKLSELTAKVYAVRVIRRAE